MKPPCYMVIAGEASGDLLAAELVTAWRREYLENHPGTTEGHQPLLASLEPRFIGAGGAKMAAAGVRLEVDMTAHAVIGLAEALKKLVEFRRLFHRLLRLALHHTPETLVCVDFSGFNRRFAQAVRKRAGHGTFRNWNPKIVQFVSPQVWASRPGRARLMAKDYDLLLSIFPFEPAWYARHTPGFRVEYVGHPIVDRHAGSEVAFSRGPVPLVVLLPGSRVGELKRHLAAVVSAAEHIHHRKPEATFLMVLPSEALAQQAREARLPAFIKLQVGDLSGALMRADLALASTGTVTLECAWFRVPTIAFYKTSWSTYQIGKRIINVRYLAMPNLLANEEVFPEFVQHDATGENLGEAGLAILNDPVNSERIRTKLAEVVASLGPPGAVRRAARTISALTRR